MSNIKIVDGTDIVLKSDTTESIDVHLPEGKYVNIVLASGKVLVVCNEDTTLYDVDESTLYTKIN